jgi:hypothetical protein
MESLPRVERACRDPRTVREGRMGSVHWSVGWRREEDVMDG